MRVKCTKYEYIYKGKDMERDLPIMETNPIGVFEGEVIDTVVLPCPNYFNRNKVGAHFVVLLDDNTFEQWPVEECTKVDDIYKDKRR